MIYPRKQEIHKERKIRGLQVAVMTLILAAVTGAFLATQ
jgi:hypothetical protein